MLRKPWKTVEQNNGTLSIFGNHHWIELEYGIPEWEADAARREEREANLEDYFVYKGIKYFISEFMSVHNRFHNPNPPEWMKEFDGYMNDSFFSGVVIKMGDGDNQGYVKAYTFIS